MCLYQISSRICEPAVLHAYICSLSSHHPVQLPTSNHKLLQCPIYPSSTSALGKAEILQKCLLTIKLGLESHENSNFKITHVQYKVPLVGLNFLGSRHQRAQFERFSSPRTRGPCVRTMTHMSSFVAHLCPVKAGRYV